MPVQMDQKDLGRGRTYLNDFVMGCGYPRLTSIPVEGEGRDKISVCGSRDGKLSKRQYSATFPSLKPDRRQGDHQVQTKNKLWGIRYRGDNCAVHPEKIQIFVQFEVT